MLFFSCVLAYVLLRRKGASDHLWQTNHILGIWHYSTIEVTASLVSVESTLSKTTSTRLVLYGRVNTLFGVQARFGRRMPYLMAAETRRGREIHDPGDFCLVIAVDSRSLYRHARA